MKSSLQQSSNAFKESYNFDNLLNADGAMEGKLLFDILPSGIGIHSNSAHEIESEMLSSSITPCISITVLYEGQVDFSVQGSRCQFSAIHNKPLLFTNIIAEHSQFERYLNKNQYVRKINVCFYKAWLYQRCRNLTDQESLDRIFSPGNRVIQLDDTAAIYRLAIPLLQHDKKADLFKQIQAEQLSLTILCKIIDMIGQQEKNLQTCPPNGYKNDITEQAIYLGSEHQLTLEQVCKKINVSSSSLQRKIKSKFGCTFGAKIKDIKLTQAKFQLENTQKSIGEIAYEAGYHYSANFITAFRRRFKTTPAELRDSISR